MGAFSSAHFFVCLFVFMILRDNEVGLIGQNS